MRRHALRFHQRPKRLRRHVRRVGRPLCRIVTLIGFALSSIGVPIVEAHPEQDHSASRDRGVPDRAAEQIEIALAGEELCVDPDWLIAPEPPHGCGCSPQLRTAGRCCCARIPTARSCCAKKPPRAGDQSGSRTAQSERFIKQDGGDEDEDRPPRGTTWLTCPCGSSSSDAWIALVAEPRLLCAVVDLAPGPSPIESLREADSPPPQVFLSPETPPPRFAST